MNLEERPPELDAGSSSNLAALFLLETENSNLRRLVVELLEKNQQLREQLRALANDRNPEISGDLAAGHRVDPRAA
jgi:hypothetical protein